MKPLMSLEEKGAGAAVTGVQTAVQLGLTPGAETHSVFLGAGVWTSLSLAADREMGTLPMLPKETRGRVRHGNGRGSGSAQVEA